MVAGPRNQFVIDKAGNKDSVLFRASADGLSIGSHTVPKKPSSASSLATPVSNSASNCDHRTPLERLLTRQESYEKDRC